MGVNGEEGEWGETEADTQETPVESQPSATAHVSPLALASPRPSGRGACFFQLPPRGGEGRRGARGRVGSFARDQAAIRQPQKPRGRPSHLLLSPLGRSFLLASSPGRTPRAAQREEGEEAVAGSPRWPPRGPGVASSTPPPSTLRAPGAGLALRPAAIGQKRLRGRSQEGRYPSWAASKEPRILQSALEPWPALSLPRRRRAGSWEFWFTLTHSLLQTTGFLHASLPPHFHSMSPCSCASNRKYSLDVI